VGETYVLDVDQLIPYYGTGEDQLHLAFNFLFVHAALEVDELRPVVEAIEEKLPAGAWPVWTGSNHDAGRLATRWAGGDEARARVALLMLMGLRGTPFLYYGDEIGLEDAELDPSQALDPVARRTGNPERNRDRYRTPMQWSEEPGAGFSADGARPWLPFGDLSRNVAAQREDPGSTLHLVRDLIALRHERDDRRNGEYETLAAPDGAWVWRRGERTLVALNLSDASVTLEPGGTVLIATDRAREGARFDGELRPWEGLVLDGGR
jgi:alpha-glucosidase